MAIISRMPDHHFVIITLIRKYQSDYLLMAFSENLVFSNQTFNPSTKTNTHTHTKKKKHHNCNIEKSRILTCIEFSTDERRLHSCKCHHAEHNLHLQELMYCYLSFQPPKSKPEPYQDVLLASPVFHLSYS